MTVSFLLLGTAVEILITGGWVEFKGDVGPAKSIIYKAFRHPGHTVS
jgi:hypothetical protein